MPIIWCANQEVTALEYNPIYHAKTKHIVERKLCNPRGGLNWDFKIYAIQFAQQFNLLP